MTRSPFELIGLPEGHAFPVLAFHPLTGCLIVHTRPKKGVLPEKRLSIRYSNVSHYEPIGSFPETVSIESFALSFEHPSIYFITFSFRATNGKAQGHWVALHRFCLDERHCEVVAQAGTLRPPQGYQQVRLSKLLSVRSDNHALFVVAGCEKRENRSSSRVDYFLAELTLADLRLKPISKLEAVFA